MIGISKDTNDEPLTIDGLKLKLGDKFKEMRLTKHHIVIPKDY